MVKIIFRAGKKEVAALLQAFEEEDLKRMEKTGHHIYSKEQRGALHYASVDASIYFTREQHCKEIKMGPHYHEGF